MHIALVKLNLELKERTVLNSLQLTAIHIVLFSIQ